MATVELGPGREAQEAGRAQAAAALTMKVLSVDDRLLAKTDAWVDLAHRALEPNPFLVPGCAFAALNELRDVQDYRLATVWRSDRQGERLVAILPFAVETSDWFGLLRTVRTMAHNYGPLGTPLIDRDHSAEAAEALLDGLLHGPIGARFLNIPFLPAGSVSQVLAEAMARRDMRAAVLHPRQRAMAMSAGPDAFTQRSLSAKSKAELARQGRRLAALGVVSLDIASTPGELDGALESFLVLEASGWKGRAGTATLQRPDRAAFLRAAIQAMARQGQARVHLLKLDGRAIAGKVSLMHNDRAWSWKTAYDETLRQYSPGVQATMLITRDILAMRGISSIDSLAKPGHPMIDHVFRGRLALGDWLIDLTPGGSRAFPVAVALERAKFQARGWARSALYRLKGQGR